MSEPLRLDVAGAGDVGFARREARRLALAAGFDAVGAEEVALAVSELGTNLVRYARNGRLAIGPVELAGRRGLEVVSEDDGPGIADVPRALVDGYSTGAGLGAGLGAVHRLADDVSIESTEQGTRIVARKWLKG